MPPNQILVGIALFTTLFVMMPVAQNINKNALVIQKKLSKGDKVIYRVYLMDKDNFNIRDLFSEHGAEKSIKENNYSLNVNDYIKGIKEHYEKEELIYIINKIVEKQIQSIYFAILLIRHPIKH